jgi:Flp pilus assembly protein TadD
VVLLRKFNLEESVVALRQAVKLDPALVEAHFNLGLALGQRGDLEGASVQFRQATALRPDFAQAHLRLAIALRRQGKADEAMDEFQQATRLAPRDPEAHYQLGLALRARGDSKGALSEFEAALSLKPDYEQARYNRAILLREAGQREAAGKDLRNLAALGQFRKDLAQSKSLSVSASERLQQHDPEGALREARAALELWNENPVAFSLMGLAWIAKGDTDQGRSNLARAIELQPD